MTKTKIENRIREAANWTETGWAECPSLSGPSFTTAEHTLLDAALWREAPIRMTKRAQKALDWGKKYAGFEARKAALLKAMSGTGELPF